MKRRRQALHWRDWHWRSSKWRKKERPTALGGFSCHRTGRTHHRSSTTGGHTLEVQPPPPPSPNIFSTGFFQSHHLHGFFHSHHLLKDFTNCVCVCVCVCVYMRACTCVCASEHSFVLVPRQNRFALNSGCDLSKK